MSHTTPPTSGKRPRGRPRQHASPAERARAWRERQRELVEAAKRTQEPVVIERIVERFIEPKAQRRQRAASGANMKAALKQMDRYSAERMLKRVNTTLSVLKELRDLARKIAPDEFEELSSTITFIGEIEDEIAKQKQKEEKRINDISERHELEIERIQIALFGSDIDHEKVFDVAKK